MAMQKESGFCTGRGFSDTQANGFLAKFHAWIQKPIASGGPGWTIIIDKSTLPVSQPIESLNISTDEITITAHGFLHGECIRFTTSGSFPTGITAGGFYYVHLIDDDTFKVSDNYKGAYEGTDLIDFTDTGSGCSINESAPYIVVSNESSPEIMGGGKTQIWEVGYYPNIFNYIFLRCWLSPGSTSDALPYGIVSGYWLYCFDGSAQEYDFRGGPDFLLVQCNANVWQRCASDTLNRLPAAVENPDQVYGKVNAGSDSSYTPGVVSQVITLESAQQASSFTEDRYYYIIFFGTDSSGDRRGSVIYGQIDAVGTAGGLSDNQIRFNLLSGSSDAHNTIFDGAIISPYYHWIYTLGILLAPGIYYECMNVTAAPSPKLIIPYYSYSGASTGFTANDNTGPNRACAIACHDESALVKLQNDNGLHIMERSLIMERNNASDTPSADGMNMIYGESSNFAVIYQTGITEMTTIITVDELDYISIGKSNVIIDASDKDVLHTMVLDTESEE